MHIILVTKKNFYHMFQLGAGAGAGAEICPEPEKSKMTGSGNPASVVFLSLILLLVGSRYSTSTEFHIF